MERVQFKEYETNKKSSNKKRNIIIMGVAIIFLVFCGVLLYIGSQPRPKNPVIVELQNKINEEVGEGFKIRSGSFYNTEPLTSMEIEAQDEQFRNAAVYENVNKIQNIVYQYAREYPNEFDMNAVHMYGDKGFQLYIDNVDEISGRETIFFFSNYIEERQKYSNDTVSMLVSAKDWYDHDDGGGYKYKLSGLSVFDNVEELSVAYFRIDDVDVLGKMKKLKYILVSDLFENELEKLEKSADKYGIVLEWSNVMETNENYINPYFPYEDNQEVVFAGRLLELDELEGNITLKFNQVVSSDKGELWKVDISQIENASDLKARNSLYYFFVTKTKIYWIEQETLTKKEKELLCQNPNKFENKRVVCQEKEKTVDKDGHHSMITMDDSGFVTYSSYYKLKGIEASFLRCFTFKIRIGLVFFHSTDTPAGRNSIEIWNDQIYYSEGYSELEKIKE